MKVLLVEDEQGVASAVTRLLSEAGHSVTWAPDGEIGFNSASTRGFDAVVLDVMLPKRNGWDVLSGLRASKVNVPVLMLTAKDELPDKVKGLNLGADDYLPKPFEPEELVARVNALLRRSQVQKSVIIRISDLEIDRESRQVTRSGQPISLTRKEYDLLEALAVNEQRVLSREVIQHNVWGDEQSYSNIVDVFIGTLRKKVDAPFAVPLIHTVVGFGYVLRVEN